VAVDPRDTRPPIVLDHVAVGASSLAKGWELFGGLLGGSWAYGGHSPGFWWGQLRFSAGPKIELLTPTSGPAAAFLERFLADRGPGFHHLNFIVPDIDVTLGKIRALGVEPVGLRVQDPRWKEAFLRPGDAFGTVIQVAEQAGQPASTSPPAALGQPGPSSALNVIEQRVADIDGAMRLFEEALDAKIVSRQDAQGRSEAVLSWPNGATLRLVQSSVDRHDGLQSGEGIAYLEFSRDDGTFGPADLETAAGLSAWLGVSLRLRT